MQLVCSGISLRIEALHVSQSNGINLSKVPNFFMHV